MTLGMQKRLSRNCKKTTVLWQTDHKEYSRKGMRDATLDSAMHRLHICCTMRANGSFAIHGNEEFFG